MIKISRWFSEPLVQFVIAGAILFGAYSWINRNDLVGDDNTILVDRRALLTFLQYRANAFEPETFGAALDGMSQEDLDEIIEAYVEEEVLYREALELGLEASDNIIRQRMVQKMTFLVTDLASADSAVDPDALEAYFAENIDAYAIQPWATFTHVFFDAESRGRDAAREAAEQARAELNASGAQFNDATRYGDGFPFLRNYVERTFEYVASHFGYEFVAEIQSLEPSATEWQGPFSSAFGEHVILMTERVARAYPALDDVRGTVERDFVSEQSNRAVEDLTSVLRERYTIEVGDIR